MIPVSDLRLLARGRLRDAKALFRANRYDGSAYICGYAVEVALKARICRTLRWPGFPTRAGEFDGRQSLKTHKLEHLLRFTGQELRIWGKYEAEWKDVAVWDPERRYLPIGTTNRGEAESMLRSAQVLVRVL
jgi:HEPN domain-containing protein